MLAVKAGFLVDEEPVIRQTDGITRKLDLVGVRGVDVVVYGLRVSQEGHSLSSAYGTKVNTEFVQALRRKYGEDK